MNSGFIVTALAAISVFTTLAVEGIKKILDDSKLEYSSNILAAIVAVVLSILVTVGYVIYFELGWTPQILVTMVALAFLSFLGATTGWDKITQAIAQIRRIGS